MRFAWWRLLLRIDHEIDFDVAAVVEARNRVARGFGLLVFGVDFEIHVGIEPGKAVGAVRFGNIGADGVRLLVVEIDDSIGDGIVVLVEDAAMDRAQLRAAFLSASGADKTNRNGEHYRQEQWKCDRAQLAI